LWHTGGMGPRLAGSIPPPKAVRLSDVAAAAGVSVSTASRALSGAGASAATVAAVLEASKRLGYRPDPVARAMRTRSSGLVGIVLPGIGNPFFAELVEALEGSLRKYQLEIILGDSSGSVQEEARRIETMVDRKVDGLLVIPTHHEESAPMLREAAHHVVVVQVDRRVDGVMADYVGLDNAAGIRLALEHLAAEACREVLFVSETGSTSTGWARLQAFKHSINRVPGLAARSPILGSFSLEFGRQSVVDLMRKRRGLPDAIVCGADFIALGVVRELLVRGVKVPEEVRVTGFDGIVFTELCDPPVTTLRQPVSAIAAEAARLLHSRLRGDPSPPHRSEVAPTLLVRRSSSLLAH
jgi:LacI family transcriptional regulator